MVDFDSNLNFNEECHRKEKSDKSDRQKKKEIYSLNIEIE